MRQPLPIVLGPFWTTEPQRPNLQRVHILISYVLTLVPSLGHKGDIRDKSEGILFQSFLWEAIVSSSDMRRWCPLFDVVHPHFLCWPQHRPSSKMPRDIVYKRLSRHVTCPNHVSFHLVTVSKSSSYGSTNCLALRVDVRKLPQALGLESLVPFLIANVVKGV